MANYSSLISTFIHILCFEWLRESLQLIFFFFIKSWSIKSLVAPLSTKAKMSMICAPSFTKMEMEMQMDFSSGSDTNTGAIISGDKDVDTFLQSKNPRFLQLW